jgi:hypothetical protein
VGVTHGRVGLDSNILLFLGFHFALDRVKKARHSLVNVVVVESGCFGSRSASLPFEVLILRRNW